MAELFLISSKSSLFEDHDQQLLEINQEAKTYNFDVQFYDRLKARLLPYTVTTQILRESTLGWRNYADKFDRPIRDFGKIEGHLAWTISTAAYYKAGGKPWKLGEIRSSVCYLGLVYKKLTK